MGHPCPHVGPPVLAPAIFLHPASGKAGAFAHALNKYIYSKSLSKR